MRTTRRLRPLTIAFVTVLVVASVPVLSNAPPGTLDAGFDGDGRVTVDFTSDDRAQDIVVQPDGKIVAVGAHDGGSSNFAVVRLNPDGSLDTTFNDVASPTPSNGDGRVDVTLGGADFAQAVALQEDGKIVVAGYTNVGGTNDFAVIRLNADGTLDTSFTSTVTVAPNLVVPSGNGRRIEFTGNDRANAVVIQRDGKIVVAGAIYDGNEDFAVVRLNTDGTLDTTFSVDGLATFTFGGLDFANDVALDADGNIYLAGSSQTGANTRFAVARLTSAGDLDANFTSSGASGLNTVYAAGRRLIDFVNDAAATDDGEDVATGILVQANGKIVVAGYGASIAGNSDFVVVRLNSTGTFDTTFNDVIVSSDTDGDGKNTVNMGTGANVVDRTGRVVQLHDGKIAVAGSIGTAGVRDDMVVLVLAANGTLDTTFSSDGEFQVGFQLDEDARGLAVQPDGSLVLAGSTTFGGSVGNTHNFAIARIGADAPTDLTFDTDGRQTADFKNADEARAVLVQPDGKTVVAGFNGDSPSNDFAIARFNLDGSADTTFSGDGRATVTFGGGDFGQALARQPDGKLIVVGYTDRNAAGAAAGRDNFAVVRFDADGTLDTTFNDVASPTASNGDGRVLVDFGWDGKAYGVAIQPDGKIVVVGTVDSTPADFGVVRLNADGSPDTSYSGDGRELITMGSVDVATCVAIQPDGRIVVAGYSNASGSNDFAVARLRATGGLDTSFDTDGRQFINFGDSDLAQALLIQPDGKIVLAGSWDGGLADFAIARLKTDGSLDPSFSGDGLQNATFGAPTFGRAEFARAVALRADGKLIVAGYSDAGSGIGDNDMAVLRLNANGAVDTTFATGGKQLIDFGRDDRAYGVAIDPATNTVVVAGSTTRSASIGSFAVARLQADAGAAAPTLPTLTINDVSVQEGNVGTGSALFTVTLSAVPSSPVSVTLTAAAGSATAGTDFGAVTGGLLFLPGTPTLTQTFSVTVAGDVTDEPGETFVVNLTDAAGATIADAQGVGTIVDDDVDITIVTPAADPVTATQSFVSVVGTAADAVGLQTVTWSNSAGGNGTATGTTAWSVDVPVVAGANVITVTARDVNGFTKSDSVTVNVSELVYYLAEGATGSFFDYDLLLANPNAVAAPVTITFLRDDGVTGTKNLVLPATSRTTVRVDDEPNFGNAAVSAVVTSTAALPLVVERSMYWDATYYGGHAGSSVTQPQTTWLFAEGSQGFFDTYVLLANASAAPVSVTVRFLREFDPPVEKTYTVQATSRFNVYAGGIPELVGKSFSIVVEASQPIIAERAMYFGTPLFNGGHESAGVPAAATTWFLAEGATGGYFDTYVLIGNSNAGPATCTVTFLRDDGTSVVKTVPVEGNRRVTLNVEDQDPLLANTAVSTTVTSDVPVIVERAMYWPGTFTSWHEAHNSFGVTQTATKWGLAEGRSGGPFGFQTYILLANPSTTTAAQVQVTFLKTDGTTVVKAYTVNPTSRFNVDVSTFVPELDGQQYGAVVTVTNGVPIAVERAVYNNASGVVWAAGTNATAVRLP